MGALNNEKRRRGVIRQAEASGGCAFGLPFQILFKSPCKPTPKEAVVASDHC